MTSCLKIWELTRDLLSQDKYISHSHCERQRAGCSQHSTSCPMGASLLSTRFSLALGILLVCLVHCSGVESLNSIMASCLVFWSMASPRSCLLGKIQVSSEMFWMLSYLLWNNNSIFSNKNDSNENDILESHPFLSPVPFCGNINTRDILIFCGLSAEIVKAIKLDHTVATGLNYYCWALCVCNIYLYKANQIRMKGSLCPWCWKQIVFPQDLVLNKFKGTFYVESCMYCNVSNKSITFWQQNVTVFKILITTSTLQNCRLS